MNRWIRITLLTLGLIMGVGLPMNSNNLQTPTQSATILAPMVAQADNGVDLFFKNNLYTTLDEARHKPSKFGSPQKAIAELEKALHVSSLSGVMGGGGAPYVAWKGLTHTLDAPFVPLQIEIWGRPSLNLMGAYIIYGPPNASYSWDTAPPVTAGLKKFHLGLESVGNGGVLVVWYAECKRASGEYITPAFQSNSLFPEGSRFLYDNFLIRWWQYSSEGGYISLPYAYSLFR